MRQQARSPEPVKKKRLLSVLAVVAANLVPLVLADWGVLAKPLLALFVSHSVSFFWDYLATGEYRRTKPEECADTLLNRLLLMQLVLACGAGITRSFDGSAGVMLLFVLAKIVLDLRPAKGYIQR
jgi:hypothetical protein